MQENPLQKLRSFGQSVWLDLLSRHLIESGTLERLIDEDAVAGVTSNPAIFGKAIGESRDYDKALRPLAASGKSVEQIYESLVIDDIRQAADLLRPLYDELHGDDGYVSLEVSPLLARDTDGTLAEARWLWREVDRPNLMIKVPGTPEGLPAIQQLLREGINVNITLLFALPRYREVTEAFLAGLEMRVADREDIRQVASVASFFLSRIDVLVDAQLDAIVQDGGRRGELAGSLRGKAAIASAKVAYEIFEEVFSSPRYTRLAGQGARRQRLLWASTSTKTPGYSDTMYVEPLIGPQTVTTLPWETLKAYRDHGEPAARLKDGLAEAHGTLRLLGEVGIDLAEVTRQLEEEGIEKFRAPYEQVIEVLRKKHAAAMESAH
jgi:transaldolase